MDTHKARDSSEGNLKVIVRFRPLINIELELADNKELKLNFIDESTVSIPRMMDEYESFSFDRVFSPEATQSQIFDFVGRPIIEDVLTGYNGTVFAYGQTGSGKTYTMMGINVNDPLTRGIIPNSASLIFNTLANSSSGSKFTVKCSMLEIYKETLKDLLGNSGELKIKQDKRRGIFIEGLTEVYVICEEEMMEVLSMGEGNRTVASTKMNTASSRSHQILIVEITQKLPNDSEKRGILNLVDLAGSEKINQTGVTGNKLEEAKKINLSLSALGNVIKALTDKSEHIPYRDSKLTRLLQESLGGNFKTTLVVNCSPHPRNLEDTLSTIKFAQRAKTIKNKAIVNIKRSPEAYMRIIDELQKQLSSTMKELELYKSGKQSPLLKKLGDKSPGLSDELLLETKFSDLKIDDMSSLEELQYTLSSLKQDQEHYSTKIKDLEEELDHEHKRRAKTEKENFELIHKLKLLMDSKYLRESDNMLCIEENKSLKKEIFTLKFHLKNLTEKYGSCLTKLSKGEAITEWEFTDMSRFAYDKNSKLPVYTEEESLDVVNTSEYNIDVPIDEAILLKNDKYAQGLCQKLEDSTNVNKDLLIFELKKQFIHSGIINCELSRSYYEILWKYKLIREKMNLRSKIIHSQKERIETLEKMALSLHSSFVRLVEILEKLETDKAAQDANLDFGKGNIIRFFKPIIQVAVQEKQVRRDARLGTALPFKSKFRPERNSLVEHDVHNKHLYLESNLQIQTLFNNQLKKANEIMHLERNNYKNLLDDLTKENSEVYSREKKRWKSFLDEFKEICENELIRKQMEINSLNELLGKWIHKYMELEESMGVKQRPGRALDEKHKEQIQELLNSTRIHIRPTKLYIQESPLHCRFKSSISTHVSIISGDSSPPNFD